MGLLRQSSRTNVTNLVLKCRRYFSTKSQKGYEMNYLCALCGANNLSYGWASAARPYAGIGDYFVNVSRL